jgi:uncharacterized SAM-binding protein YcdF (DUF218 family)
MEWMETKSTLMSLLTNPWIMLPILAGFALLPWTVLRKRKRWVVGSLATFPFLLYLVLPFPPIVQLAEWGLTVWIPQDSGHAAEALVLLGRGGELSRSRIDPAIEMWQANRAPLIFLSGNVDAERMARALVNRGVPQSAIQLEGCSQTTEENALFTAVSLQPQGIDQIILITDPPHMLRSWLTFRSLGFEVIPHMSPGLNSREGYHLPVGVLREYVGLLSYSVLGRFMPRQAPDQLFAQVDLLKESRPLQ